MLSIATGELNQELPQFKWDCGREVCTSFSWVITSICVGLAGSKPILSSKKYNPFFRYLFYFSIYSNFFVSFFLCNFFFKMSSIQLGYFKKNLFIVL